MATKPSKMVKTINASNPKGADITDEELFQATVKQMDSNSANQLPEYRAGANFEPWGKTFLDNPRVFNDYLDTLAVQYGVIFVKSALAQNPLGYFRRGKMPYGGKIESVVFDVIKPKMFRQDLIDGAENPYAIETGRVMGHTYIETEDIESQNSILDTQDTMYFQTLEQFNDFVFGKIAQLVNGAILDEFYHTKLTMSVPLVKGLVSIDYATDTKALAKKILAWTKKLRYFRNDSNAVGFTQATIVDDIVVVIPVDANVNLDMDYFANVYNSELTQARQVKYLEVDEFPDVFQYNADHEVVQADLDKNYLSSREWRVGDTVPKGTLGVSGATDVVQTLDGSKIGAFILDRDALQLWDQLPLTLSTISNPKKRYTNIFQNKKTFFMFVQALNSKVVALGSEADLFPNKIS